VRFFNEIRAYMGYTVLLTWRWVFIRLDVGSVEVKKQEQWAELEARAAGEAKAARRSRALQNGLKTHE